MPWMAGSSTWITGQPASASSVSSSFMAFDSAMIRSRRFLKCWSCTPVATIWPEMAPNLTGLRVWRCATFHTRAYSSGPRVTGPVTLGSTRVSSTSNMMSPAVLSRLDAVRPRPTWWPSRPDEPLGGIGEPGAPADVAVAARIAVGQQVEAGARLVER